MKSEFKIVVVLFAGFFLFGNLFSQSLPIRSYSRVSDSLILDSLRAEFGQNKIIAPGLELQALRALSHYPELKRIRIKFKLHRSKIAHSSQPGFATIWKPKNKRTYIVFVSTDVPDFYFQGMQWNLPYNAQVGVLGHELGHTTQYLNKRFLGLIWTGIKYGLSKRFVKRMEHETDQIAIHHELGWQLFDWSKIAHPLLEQAGRGQNYMLPEEIEQVLEGE